MSYVFFTDRDLGKLFPKILRDSGLIVEKHSDHFKDDTKDEDWLEKVGKKGWIVLTHDKGIRYKPNEIDAIMQSGIGLFVLVGKATHKELAENFVATIHKIYNFIEKNSPPFIAKTYRPSIGSKQKIRKFGEVKLWLSHKDFIERSK